MYKITQDIFEDVESMILGFSIRRGGLTPIKKLLFYPLKFLHLGFSDFSKPMENWVVGSFIALVLVSVCGQQFWLDKELTLILLNIVICLIFALVAFSTPSIYAFYHIKEKTINNIITIFNTHKLDSSEKIELFENNIDLIEERVNSRVDFFKWLIATCWAIYVFFSSFQLKIINFAKDGGDFTAVREFGLSFIYILIFSSTALLLMISYKRASNILIKAIKYSCNEQKFIFHSKYDA
jgi:hypothetical protein